jgi:circadian clock protein KaiC
VHEIISAVKRLDAKRVVLDSLIGFEMALAPGFRHEFRESLYRMIVALMRLGVTVVSTVEIEDTFEALNLSNFAISFLADDIIRLRYVSINGQLRKMMLVVKMRRSEHSIDMCEYQINDQGLAMGKPLRGYRALTSGIPEPWSEDSGKNEPQPRSDGQPAARKSRPRKNKKRGKRSK